MHVFHSPRQRHRAGLRAPGASRYSEHEQKVLQNAINASYGLERVAVPEGAATRPSVHLSDQPGVSWNCKRKAWEVVFFGRFGKRLLRRFKAKDGTPAEMDSARCLAEEQLRTWEDRFKPDSSDAEELDSDATGDEALGGRGSQANLSAMKANAKHARSSLHKAAAASGELVLASLHKAPKVPKRVPAKTPDVEVDSDASCDEAEEARGVQAARSRSADDDVEVDSDAMDDRAPLRVQGMDRSNDASCVWLRDIGAWRVVVLVKGEGGKKEFVQQHFRPKDASPEEIERTRMEAVRCRDTLLQLGAEVWPEQRHLVHDSRMINATSALARQRRGGPLSVQPSPAGARALSVRDSGPQSPAASAAPADEWTSLPPPAFGATRLRQRRKREDSDHSDDSVVCGTTVQARTFASSGAGGNGSPNAFHPLDAPARKRPRTERGDVDSGASSGAAPAAAPAAAQRRYQQLQRSGSASPRLQYQAPQQPMLSRREADTDEGVVLRSTKQSGVPDIHWSSRGGWRVEFTHPDGRRNISKFFPLAVYMQEGRSYEEAESAALRDAKHFRSSMMRDGMMQEQFRKKEPEGRGDQRGVSHGDARGDSESGRNSSGSGPFSARPARGHSVGGESRGSAGGSLGDSRGSAGDYVWGDAKFSRNGGAIIRNGSAGGKVTQRYFKPKDNSVAEEEEPEEWEPVDSPQALGASRSPQGREMPVMMLPQQPQSAGRGTPRQSSSEQEFVDRESGTWGITWSKWERVWRVSIVFKDEAGQHMYAQKNFSPVDSSPTEVERVRLDAMRYRDLLVQRRTQDLPVPEDAVFRRMPSARPPSDGEASPTSAIAPARLRRLSELPTSVDVRSRRKGRASFGRAAQEVFDD